MSAMTMSLNYTKTILPRDVINFYVMNGNIESSTEIIKGVVSTYSEWNPSRDPFYGGSLKCYVNTKSGKPCNGYITKGLRTCKHPHEGAQTANLFVLLSDIFSKYFDRESILNFKIDLFLFTVPIGLFLFAVRAAGNSKCSVLFPSYYLSAVITAMQVATLTYNVKILNYIYFTVKLDYNEYSPCTGCGQYFTHIECRNCWETKSNLIGCIYNKKDSICGILLRYGFLYENLPRELIVEILTLSALMLS